MRVLVADDVDDRRSNTANDRPADLPGGDRLTGDDEAPDELVRRRDGRPDQSGAAFELVGVALRARLDDGSVDAEDAEAREIRARLVANQDEVLLRARKCRTGSGVGVDPAREMGRVHERVVRSRGDAERIASPDLSEIAGHVPIPSAAKFPES